MWLVPLLIALSADPFPAQGGSGDELERLLEEVRIRLDYTSKETFNDLARKGDAKSFEVLVKAIGWLKSPWTLEDAYLAFWFFRKDRVLGPRAVEFLLGEALRRPKDVRDEAVFPLSYFGAVGQAALVRLVRESKDEDVRWEAIAYALEGLLASGEEQALELVLAHADAEDVAAHAQPFRAFDPDVARPGLVKKLQDRRTSVGWVLVLIEALRDDPGEDVVAALCSFLRHRSTVLQVAALDELVRRGEEVQARVQLERMRVSAAPHVKVEVVRIQTHFARGDPAWRATLVALAGASEPADRIAAAVGLGVLADADALERLTRLLEDRSWKVRHAVLDVACEVRRKELLLPVIRRLDQEQGALCFAVAQALERMTGIDLGRKGEAWTRWYEEHRADFELPTLAELEAKAAHRAAARPEDASVAVFYGLPVRSQNVCFVVDLSGSMDEPAEGEAEDAELTRFDVAKRELDLLLARLPPESRCNLVFFGDEVERWQTKLRLMDAKGRAAAQAFVAAREIGGGTNIYGALQAAFADDATDTIYLMSDGDPSAGAVTDAFELRAEVKQWNRVARVTVHCISVGQESKLLADIARDSGGYYLEVGADKPEGK